MQLVLSIPFVVTCSWKAPCNFLASALKWKWVPSSNRQSPLSLRLPIKKGNLRPRNQWKRGSSAAQEGVWPYNHGRNLGGSLAASLEEKIPRSCCPLKNEAEFSKCVSGRLSHQKKAFAQRSVFRWQFASLWLVPGIKGKDKRYFSWCFKCSASLIQLSNKLSPKRKKVNL